MICRHCGAELAQGATFCVRCGQPTGVAQQTSGPGAPTVQQRPQQGGVLPSVPMSAPPASVPPHARQGATQRGSGRSAYLFVIALSAVLIVAAAVVAALFATGVISNGRVSQSDEVSESSGDDAVETGGGDAAELDDEDARAATAVVEDLNDMFDELLANGLSDDDVTEFGYDVFTIMPPSIVESIIEQECEGDADLCAQSIGGNTASPFFYCRDVIDSGATVLELSLGEALDADELDELNDGLEGFGLTATCGYSLEAWCSCKISEDVEDDQFTPGETISGDWTSDFNQVYIVKINGDWYLYNSVIARD